MVSVTIEGNSKGESKVEFCVIFQHQGKIAIFTFCQDEGVILHISFILICDYSIRKTYTKLGLEKLIV